MIKKLPAAPGLNRLLMLILLVPLFAGAQTSSSYLYNSINFLPRDLGSYSGYSICLHSFEITNLSNPASSTLENGYIAVGNRTGPRGEHDSIHLLEIPMWDGSPASTSPPFPQIQSPRYGGTFGFNIGVPGFEDIRVVSLIAFDVIPHNTSTVPPASLAVLLQARSVGKADQAIVLLLNCRQYGMPPVVVKTITVEQPNGNLYPQGITSPWNFIVAGNIYICGYVLPNTQPMFPAEPTLASSKMAFVTKIDPYNSSTLTKYFNTVQQLNPAPAGPPKGVNDYDGATRIRWVHSYGSKWLHVIGSANTSATTSWPGNQNWPVNASASWVANLDEDDLSILGQDFVGVPQVDPQIAPDQKAGLCAADFDWDGHTPDHHYLLQNRLDHDGWYLTHMESCFSCPNTTSISTPITGDNSFYFSNPKISQKAMVFLEQWGNSLATNGSGRAEIFGSKDNINFSVGFDAYYCSSTGVNMSGCPSPVTIKTPPRYYFQNSLNPPASVVTNQPYWLNTDLAIWANPDIAAKWYTGTSIYVGNPSAPRGSLSPTLNPFEGDVAMMSQIQGQNGALSVAPRFMQGDGDCGVDIQSYQRQIINCGKAFEPQPLTQYIKTTSLSSLTVQQDIEDNPMNINDLAAAIPIYPIAHTERNCVTNGGDPTFTTHFTGCYLDNGSGYTMKLDVDPVWLTYAGTHGLTPRINFYQTGGTGSPTYGPITATGTVGPGSIYFDITSYTPHPNGCYTVTLYFVDAIGNIDVNQGIEMNICACPVPECSADFTPTMVVYNTSSAMLSFTSSYVGPVTAEIWTVKAHGTSTVYYSGSSSTSLPVPYGSYDICHYLVIKDNEGQSHFCNKCRTICYSERFDPNYPQLCNADFTAVMSPNGSGASLSLTSAITSTAGIISEQYIITSGTTTIGTYTGGTLSGISIPYGNYTICHRVNYESGISCVHCIDICLSDATDDPSNEMARKRPQQAAAEASNSGVSVRPNPATSQAIVTARLQESGTIQIQLVDITGRVVYTSENQHMSAGSHDLNIPTLLLPNGLYTIKIFMAGKLSTLKLSIQK